jgi:hypothetical protein
MYFVYLELCSSESERARDRGEARRGEERRGERIEESESESTKARE